MLIYAVFFWLPWKVLHTSKELGNHSYRNIDIAHSQFCVSGCCTNQSSCKSRHIHENSYYQLWSEAFMMVLWNCIFLGSHPCQHGVHIHQFRKWCATWVAMTDCLTAHWSGMSLCYNTNPVTGSTYSSLSSMFWATQQHHLWLMLYTLTPYLWRQKQFPKHRLQIVYFCG
jgi:hypothetical protein